MTIREIFGSWQYHKLNREDGSQLHKFSRNHLSTITMMNFVICKLCLTKAITIREEEKNDSGFLEELCFRVNKLLIKKISFTEEFQLINTESDNIRKITLCNPYLKDKSQSYLRKDWWGTLQWKNQAGTAWS